MLFAAAAVASASGAEISFNRDIRPILSANCYACHGPDKKARKADRRLDTREGALAESEGVRAIVPGSVEQSELASRVSSNDPDEIMPPPKSDKKLTAQQIALLKQWIKDGAPYEAHWSLIAPKRPNVPGISDFRFQISDWEKREPARSAKLREQEKELLAWPRNPIDNFILARLLQEGLAPSPEASPATLIRRLSYDLTGLPPTPAEIDAFLSKISHGSHQSHAALVDKLLASPRYGERMARDWLDLSRLRGHARLPSRRRARHVVVARLGDQIFQRKQTLRSIHDRAVCRRPAAERDRGAEDRDRLPTERHDQL
jgi:mono/diheme cytochrome c family protein